jgi:DNA-3-methyladenine glycosylase I
MGSVKRCEWAQSPLMIEYHDTEWGVPVHDDRLLFEFLILEGAQAGLSWDTILKKRAAYRLAFDQFDPQKVATYDEAKATELLTNPGIVRNRRKIAAAVINARAFLAVQQGFGSFDAYVWDFLGGQPKVNAWQSLRELPAATPESIALSRDLVRRGFKFVGPTICYAFMQAVGLVNDHEVDCFRHAQVATESAPESRPRSSSV